MFLTMLFTEIEIYYVVDLLIIGNDNELISLLIAYFNDKFVLKDLRPLHYFLSFKVTRNSHGFHICHIKYVEDLLA